MSDDSFIREVNEELRQDQAKALWRRYGPALIGAVVLVVAATAGWVGYDYWTQSRANASGDRFSAALELASDGRLDEAQAAFEALQADGYGAYPVLAKLRTAAVLAERGEADAAVAEFDAVAADGSVPASIRDMARLRAGYVLVDSGSYDDVAARVEVLTADSASLRHAAREALALSAWREGRAADALALFEQITDDESAPRNARQRATVMVELLRGSGAAS
ncbi:MAG: tetratricopeptide repeat protein [Rhizobiaceae bacterium]|nr:tetratricopeptide repeat protein [Rhizobiaceae bacterium]